MIRPLLSLKRLPFDEKDGKVCYRYGESSEEVERMEYLEFIARTTSPIPEKGQVMVRYFSGCQWVEIAEKGEEFLAIPKRNSFLPKLR